MSLGHKFIDIGVNLTDPVFRGIYHGSQKHADDFLHVLDRAWANGVKKMIVTGGSLKESEEAIQLSETDARLTATVGCHPTRCSEFASGPDGDASLSGDAYYNGLLSLVKANPESVVAVGECGLDYDRLHFCEKETQLKYFERQFDLAEATSLPMFLHLRNASEDFLPLMRRHRDRIKGGVVHSFDGTWAEAESLLDLGLFLGLNGCSLKTKENLDVAARIPLDRLMLETDAPWCEIKNSHAGISHVKTVFPVAKKAAKWEATMGVKGRNEPGNIVQVAEVIAGVRSETIHDLTDACFQNTQTLFFNPKS